MSGVPFLPDPDDLDGHPGALGFDPTREHPENDPDEADQEREINTLIDQEAVDRIRKTIAEIDKIEAERKSLSHDKKDKIDDLLNDVPGLTTDSFKVLHAIHKAAANPTEAANRMIDVGRAMMRTGERWYQPTLPSM